MHVVMVTIEALPGTREALEEALRHNAEHSRQEPDCLKWEWSQHCDDPDRFAIYEVYTDQEAFLAHKASVHFAEWVEASGPCIAKKEAGQYRLEDPDLRTLER